MLKWILNIFNKLKGYSRPLFSYSILKPCFRCVYAKRYEPVLIVSLHRGPRILVNYKGHTYVRKGDCKSIVKCYKCFRGNIDKTPCKWILIK